MVFSHVNIPMTSYVLPSLALNLLNEPKLISIWSKHLPRLLGDIPQPSVIFRSLQKFSTNNVRARFGQSSENFKIFGKCSEIFGKLQKSPVFCCLYHKKNFTCPLVDTNFIFSSSTRYLTPLLHSLVRYMYRVKHSKIKFQSTSGHVLSSVCYAVILDEENRQRVGVGKVPALSLLLIQDGGITQTNLNWENGRQSNRLHCRLCHRCHVSLEIFTTDWQKNSTFVSLVRTYMY